MLAPEFGTRPKFHRWKLTDVESRVCVICHAGTEDRRTIWAKEYLIISSDSVGRSADGNEEYHDPPVMLAVYISDNQEQIRNQ